MIPHTYVPIGVSGWKRFCMSVPKYTMLSTAAYDNWKPMENKSLGDKNNEKKAAAASVLYVLQCRFKSNAIETIVHIIDARCTDGLIPVMHA